MFRFKRREKSLLDNKSKRLYELFVAQGFGGGRRLKQNMALVFSTNQLSRLAQEFRFRINDMPSELAFGQWLGMFEFLKDEVPEGQRQKFLSRSRKF